MLAVFKDLKYNIIVTRNKFKIKIVKNISRNIITDANAIMITTNNCNEIKFILLNISKLFNKFDLNIFNVKIRIINYFINKKNKN